MNEEIYPCRCGHPLNTHGTIDQPYTNRAYHEDLKEWVEAEASFTRDICTGCDTDCCFEPMTNLEYMEWKYDQLQNPL